MKNGILEDGSLSSRLKGDLYWKKQKLMLKSEEETGGNRKGTKHFLERFIDASAKTVSDPSAYPGMDSEIRESRLAPNKLSEYARYIPDNYISQIKSGSLRVWVFHRNEEFAALAVVGLHDGWLELVWVSLSIDMRGEDESFRIISHIIAKARAAESFRGVFAEIHEEEMTDVMDKVCIRAGMRIDRRKNNLYEFRLGDVKNQAPLLGAAKKFDCVPLFMLTDEQKDAVEEAIYKESGSVPVQLPIPWDNYRQDMSFAYYDPDEGSPGLMLMSEVGDTLVFDLLYGNNPVVTAALLGTALESSAQSLSQDQKIIVPIVQEATRALVEKLVPGAEREELIEAYLAF